MEKTAKNKKKVECVATIRCEGGFLLFNLGEGYTLFPFGEDDLKKARIPSSSFVVERKILDGVEILIFEIQLEDKAKALNVVVDDDVPRDWFYGNRQNTISNAKLTSLALLLING